MQHRQDSLSTPTDIFVGNDVELTIMSDVNQELGSLVNAGLPKPTVTTTGSVDAVSNVPNYPLRNEWEGNLYYVGTPSSASRLTLSVTSTVKADTIYGKSSTVQPPAYIVTFFKRIN